MWGFERVGLKAVSSVVWWVVMRVVKKGNMLAAQKD